MDPKPAAAVNSTGEVSERGGTLRSLSRVEDRENEIGICLQSESTSHSAISVWTFGGISLPIFFPDRMFLRLRSH